MPNMKRHTNRKLQSGCSSNGRVEEDGGKLNGVDFGDCGVEPDGAGERESPAPLNGDTRASDNCLRGKGEEAAAVDMKKTDVKMTPSLGVERESNENSRANLE